MPPQVAFIHTSPSMVPVFKPLAAELLPAGVNVFNVVDESLLCDIIRDGRCPPNTARRLAGHVMSAADAGANLYRVRALRRAALVVQSLDQPVATILADAGIRALREQPGIGPSIAKRIAELALRN